MQPASDQARPPKNALRRWGPLALIVVLLVGVGVVVAVSAGGGDDDDDTEEPTAELTDGVGAPEPTGDMPVTYVEAEEAGTLDDYEWGDRCDTETGKLKVQSVYASPCVPVFDGDDNGGATAPGVTADTVRIVRYVSEENADLQAILTGVGANDTPEESAQTYQQFLQLSSALSETYGRTVELVDFQGTGAGDDIVAAKADATQIVEELEPFAVLGGPGLDRGTFGQEITSNGIVCIDCAGALPADMVDGMRPYIWSGLPPSEQFLQTLNTWLTNLAETPDGTKAIYAGTPEFQERERKLGVIHFDQDPPLLAVPEEDWDESVADQETYVLDFAVLPQRATELMAKFKNEEITTIIFLGDPIMPGYLMDAATTQEYYPEWIITGTVLTDTNVLARGWNPAQMTQAFGISQLAAPVARELQDATVIVSVVLRRGRDTARAELRTRSRPRRWASSCAASTWPAPSSPRRRSRAASSGCRPRAAARRRRR